MFTGIVQAMGTVYRIRQDTGAKRIEVSQPDWRDVLVGESVAVDGVCLTVVASQDHRMTFEVIPQTFKLTTLGHLKPGSRVNLERALTPSDRLSGHFVSGHIDGVGKIVKHREAHGELALDVQLPKPFRRFVIDKGAIAIDGISLTVGEIHKDRLRVFLIPQTQRMTTLGEKPVGSRVNIELDVIGKYVDRHLRERCLGRR